MKKSGVKGSSAAPVYFTHKNIQNTRRGSNQQDKKNPTEMGAENKRTLSSPICIFY